MHITIGVDVGTTTTTALALDADRGDVLAAATDRNDAETTSPQDKARGRSEWDAEKMVQKTFAILRATVERLGGKQNDIVGIGMTGQQHGVVLLDERLRPVTPFIGWQDRRGDEPMPNANCTFTERAIALVGADGPKRTGCTLATGFLGVTLFWLKEMGTLAEGRWACFITDFLGVRLTGAHPVTDPTMGASSGIFRLQERDWDGGAVRALGLPPALFPPVREPGDRLGTVSPEAARATGLPAGLPVFVGLGDNQASFLGSVARPEDSVLVNVGTGAQVTQYVEQVHHAPLLETRPFPRRGYLLVNAGLCGGRAYAILERFFRLVGAELFHIAHEENLYRRMNALAEQVPRGAEGLRCEPFFAGIRSDPNRRAVWSGMSDRNFTPAHMVRALLEGMARGFFEGYVQIQKTTGRACTHLVGAGNGLRENPVLARAVSEQFGLSLSLPIYREEAAYGAALVAAYGAGVFSDLSAAGSLIRYEHAN